MSRGLKDLFTSNSLRNYCRDLVAGVGAPKDSGAHRYAVFQIQRVIIPGFSTVLFLASLIAMAVVFGKDGDRVQEGTIPITVMSLEPPIEPDTLSVITPVTPPIVPNAGSLNDASVAGVMNPATVDGSDGSVNFGPAGPGEPAKPTEILAPVTSGIGRKGLPTLKDLANRDSVARDVARHKYNGPQAGEDAVLRALRWLKTHQDDNGAWAKADATHPAAMAGLALLTFLAHGETPADSLEFGPTVEKAINYLLSTQKENGMFADGGNAYGHGIDTYAISEAYAMTKIVSLKDAAEKAIQLIIDGQQKTGGYDYHYAQTERFDLSVSGWQFQAMKAAKMAGAANPGLDAAIAKAINFLERNAFANAGESSGFVYSGKQGVVPNGGATPSMTGAGTLCLQLLGQGHSPCVAAGLRFLERVQPRWPSGKDKDGKSAKAPLYTWYYVTQAKFQSGGKTWNAWNLMFPRELIANQKSDGHWEDGDWGGSVYTTCLCTLMLEVYYRYLPSYQKLDEKPEAPKKSAEDSAIQISV